MKTLNVNKKLKRNPRYTRLKRHLACFIKHSTVKKVMNFFVVELERILRREILYGKPYILILDSSSVCNLKCPLCPTGSGKIKRNPPLLKFDDFKIIVDKLGSYLYEIYLHNWGEPFLNPDLFKMIEYASLKNIGTTISSNLNIISDSQIDMIFKSTLEYLVVSLDSISRETYLTYRVKGDFSLVIENIRKIISRKRKLKSPYPVIEWQFIVMKQNSNEIEGAKKLADELGVDLIRFIPVGFPFGASNLKQLKEKWAFPSQKFDKNKKESTCFYLYRSLIINSDGRVAPCCIVYKKEHDFASFFKEDFNNIWNGEKFQTARSLFGKNRIRSSDVDIPCLQCDLFGNHTSLKHPQS